MEQPNESLSASMEDYMEAIFHIEDQKRAARVKDIADRLHVSNASVTGALRLLAEKELINYAPYNIITLTSKGREVAQDIARRHETLRDFFVKILAIDEVEAETAACKMEHGMSMAILARITQFLEFLETCPRGGLQWFVTEKSFCAHGGEPGQCEQCLRQCLADLPK